MTCFSFAAQNDDALLDLPPYLKGRGDALRDITKSRFLELHVMAHAAEEGSSLSRDVGSLNSE